MIVRTTSGSVSADGSDQHRLLPPAARQFVPGWQPQGEADQGGEGDR